jgi:hypothetical protein
MRDGLWELLEMVYTVDSCIRSRCGGRQDIAYVFVAAERGKHGRALDFASLLSLLFAQIFRRLLRTLVLQEFGSDPNGS